MPLVSIIIPVFNGARYLRETVDSALQQTCREKEIIIVDDGSTDDSLGIAQSYASPTVRVVTQKNRGASAARNRGLAEARGNYLQFLDADDLLAPDKIEVQLTALADKPNLIASGRWGVFFEKPADAKFSDEIMYHSAAPIDWLVEAWTRAGMMQPGAWLTPRPILERAGLWNESLSLDDDGEYFGRVLLASGGVWFVPSATVLYRSHAGPRLSAIRGERAWRSSLLSCELKAQALLSIEDSPRTRRACASNYSRFAWENFPEGGSLVDQAIAQWGKFDRSVRPPAGGRKEKLLADCLGWKNARRWQKFWQRNAAASNR